MILLGVLLVVGFLIRCCLLLFSWGVVRVRCYFADWTPWVCGLKYAFGLCLVVGVFLLILGLPLMVVYLYL